MNEVIQINHLSKRLGDKLVLNNLSLNVEQSSIFAFLGNNGAGKSTTIRILLGLVKADAGSVNVFGQDIRDSGASYLKQVGCLIDSPALYPNLTGKEFLSLSTRLKGLNRSCVERALQLVDMTNDAKYKISTYSLGMKQRLAVAWALLGEPRLLVLDEPTNGLDPNGMVQMRSLLKRLPEETGCTVFLSSHLLDEVEKTATHVGIIDHGCVSLTGPLSSILSNEGKLAIDIQNTVAGHALLTKHGFKADIESKQTLLVNQVAAQECVQIHGLLHDGGIGLLQSRFIKPSLEEHFQALNQNHD